MKRLNLDDPNCWNRWRELYYDLTPEENIEFGNDIFARYPGQASFNPAPFKNELTRFFNRYKRSPNLLEIGGWRGELALQCFQSQYPITGWHNIDMCKAAVDASVFGPMSVYPYTAWFPHAFDWFNKLGKATDFDLCFSAHTIEHLTTIHLLQLMDFLENIPTIIFEAPITNEGQKWDGYGGTHILEAGWSLIGDEFQKRGFSVTQLTDICYRYEK